MKQWKVESAGESWTVDAPDDVTEAEVNEFAAANYASWQNGGRYRMDPVVPEYEDKAPGETPEPVKPDAGPTKEDYDRAVATLDQQIGQLTAERNKRRPIAMRPGMDVSTADVSDLDAQINELTALRDKLAIGHTGSTVGGISGSLVGGGIGVGVGALTGPFAPVAMPVGGLIGSILGGLGGTVAGTHLWDIPAARETREVTDQEAADLIKHRAIESLIWDGAFVLILGPGGRAIGKMSKGARFLPALKAAAKESMSWDQIAKVKENQILRSAGKRADLAPSGLATQVSRAIDEPTLKTSKEATEDLLVDIAKESGGRLPTKGEMVGIVKGPEVLARKQAPLKFFENDLILANTAQSIRNRALQDLDKAGAYGGPEFGEAISRVVADADANVKRITGPIFDRAEALNATIDMRATQQFLQNVLFRDREALGQMAPAERAWLEGKLKLLAEEPYMSPGAVQGAISGFRAAQRGITESGIGKPSSFFSKAVRDLIEVADGTYMKALDTLDPSLKPALTQARNLYRQTLSDLYDDATAIAASKAPEDVGRALTAKGTVTEIRELRKALDRAVENAPGRRLRSPKTGEVVMSKVQMKAERARIDAGLVKGFIERQTQSLEGLGTKLADPEFRQTLKELLTGPGVADRELGRRVLTDLDRTLAAIKLASPTMAPQPGRLGAGVGVGSIGATTMASAAAGGAPIHQAAPAAFSFLWVTRMLGKALATYMTTGNAGMLHGIERAATLYRLAGRNAAAAEAARAAWQDVQDWDAKTGD